MSIIVVGGGVTAPITAFLLAQAGLSVTLLDTESTGTGAACGSAFDRIVDEEIDPIDPADPDLAALLQDLGLSQQLERTETASELLTFRAGRARSSAIKSPSVPIGSIVDHLQLGLLSRRIRQRIVPSPSVLDATTARDWLCAEMGEPAVERYWAPLLRTRFGRGWTSLSALVACREIERCSHQRAHGWFTKGLGQFIDSLKSGATQRGARIERCRWVESVGFAEDGLVVRVNSRSLRAARVVLATPMREARRVLTCGGIHTSLEAMPHAEIETVSAWFELDRPLFGNYWTAIDDPRVAFHAVVELTAVRSPGDFGGHHVACVLDRSSLSSNGAAGQTARLEACREGLALLQPDRAPPVISKCRMVRRAEALFPVKWFDSRPPFGLVPSRIYLASDSQTYPEIPSLESRVRVAQRVVEHVVARERIDSRMTRPENAATT